jgi:putative phosphoribosyl transferase
MKKQAERDINEQLVKVVFESVVLDGILTVPSQAEAIVIFAHGSGSSRFSHRNLFVAESLQKKGLATLLFDLLTRKEEEYDERTGELRFDISLLTMRLAGTTTWLSSQKKTSDLAVGYFGASTGAAAALSAAAMKPDIVRAVVSRGGRPDLAGPALKDVEAPTLFIVGGNDTQVIRLNEKALAQMSVERKLEIVPGATHLFEEPGTLETVALLASRWFLTYLTSDGAARYNPVIGSPG